MSGPVYWISEAGRLEESDGVFILTLGSGGEGFRFAMPPHIARRFCEAGIRTINQWERDEAEREPIIPFERAEPGKRKRD